MLLSLLLTSAILESWDFNLLKVATDLILKNWDPRCYLVLLAWRSDRVSDGCPDGAALIMIPGYQPPTSNTAFHIGVFCILHRIFCIFFAFRVFSSSILWSQDTSHQPQTLHFTLVYFVFYMVFFVFFAFCVFIFLFYDPRIPATKVKITWHFLSCVPGCPTI